MMATLLSPIVRIAGSQGTDTAVWLFSRLHLLKSLFFNFISHTTHSAGLFSGSCSPSRRKQPTIFLQRVSEEREREGAFSRVLGCPDVKEAFLQVPQEKPSKVNLREEFLAKRDLPGQRVGAKAWLDFFTGSSPRTLITSSVF